MDAHLIITFTVKTDRVTAFSEIMRQVKSDLPKIDGCKAVRIFNDKSNACVFSLIETWTSEERHKAHIDSFMKSGGWDHLSSHLACDPVSSYHREI